MKNSDKQTEIDLKITEEGTYSLGDTITVWIDNDDWRERWSETLPDGTEISIG